MLVTGPGLTRRHAQAESIAEPLMVFVGHPEEVRHDEHGEGLRIGADELAAAAGGDELVELLVGESPHELLVVLEPFRGDQTHQQRPLAGVRRWVHGHHVLVHRQLVSVAIDDLADIVARERHRESCERPNHRVARREVVGVAVDVAGLVVAGHSDHTEVGERQHRALVAQVLQVRVRVVVEGLVAEVVDRLPVAHALSSRT